MSKLARVLGLLLVLGLASPSVADDETLAAQALKMRMVTIEVCIVELAEKPAPDETLDAEASQKLIARIRELETQGKLAALTRLRFSTLDNNLTTAQSSERTPVVTGRNQFPGQPGRDGQQSGQTFQMREMGTMVTAIPRIEPGDTILIDLVLEKSNPTRDTRPAADTARTDTATALRIATLNVKTTVRVPNGQTIVVQSNASTAGDAASRTVVLLTARADQAPVVDVAHLNTERQLKIFALQFAAAGSLHDVLRDLFPNQRLTIAVETRTNSLIIRGTPEDLKIAEAILLKLDEAPTAKSAERK